MNGNVEAYVFIVLRKPNSSALSYCKIKKLPLTLQAIVFRVEDFKDLTVPLPAIIQVSKNKLSPDELGVASYLLCLV